MVIYIFNLPLLKLRFVVYSTQTLWFECKLQT
jgi:hypothetical protein